MREVDFLNDNVSDSSLTNSTTPPSKSDPPDNHQSDNAYQDYPTDTIAAVTIAVLAVVILLTVLLVFRALRKRRRMRQGDQFGEGHISTLTTGVMGTGGSAYNSSFHNVPVRGPVIWQSVNPSTSGAGNSDQRQEPS